jgi:hypothetical protein
MGVMKSIRILAVAVAIFASLAAQSRAAYAFGKHAPKPPKAFRNPKKNTNPYAYLAPKKPKKASGGWYQSPVSGHMVYGKKKK